jgi:valyl-tRNA synthetase
LQGNAQVTEVADKWILTKLNKVIAGATAAFEVFEYSRARQITEDFFWKDFCDNYLEIAKARSYGETCSEAEQQSALITIKTCVEVLLKLWAPFVPHITEELNAIIFDAKESIHARGNWPKANLPQDEAAEKLGDALVEALEVVRKYKSDRNISIKFPIKKLTVPASLKPVEYDLKTVTSSNQIEWNDSATTEIELEEAA